MEVYKQYGRIKRGEKVEGAKWHTGVINTSSVKRLETVGLQGTIDTVIGREEATNWESV